MYLNYFPKIYLLCIIIFCTIFFIGTELNIKSILAVLWFGGL